MTPIELLAETAAGNGGMVKMTLADFSDADMVVRPCPGANHAAWQLGHLVSSEAKFVDACRKGAAPELPAGFAEKFSKQTQSIEDAKAFPPKQQLLDLHAKVRAATVAWIRSLTPEDLNQPSPITFGGLVPTIGHMVTFLNTHLMMHVGQMQVIRRKLGKPVLF